MQHTTLTFRFPLHPGDTRAFRAAIVECVGLGHHLFHGHDNSEPGVTRHANAYPLIRFGVYRGRARITGLGAGADAIRRHLLPVLPDMLYIAGRPCSTAEWQLENQLWEPELEREFLPFGIYQWLALNRENYAAWKQYADRPAARNLILDRCLTGQLRKLAGVVAPEVPYEGIVGRVARVDRVKKVRWKGTAFIAFDVVAEATFRPHPGWGLGRCHSFGFGEVCTERTYTNLTQCRETRKPLIAGAH